MLIKLGVIFMVLAFSIGQDVKLDWDLAVVVENQIRLLTSNGTLIDTKDQPFSSLKALAYDNVRNQFIVSDMHKNNDTVYTVQFEKHITVPIIKGLPGDVQGLAVDPIDDQLYWTDEVNHTIHQISLEESNSPSKEFFILNDKRPHALAIDICHRYIYFTNPTSSKPSIDRLKLDGTGHEIFVDNLILTPEGITIDYEAQRLYWADSRVGTSGGRIESIGLDGKERKIVVERNTMQPFGIAVGEDAIYWTDTNNNGLYKFTKGQDPEATPQKLAMFGSMPMGLVVNNNIIKEMPDCSLLELATKEYKEEKKEEADSFNFQEGEPLTDCLNGGELQGNYCSCQRGFSGKRCEISYCQNFCLNGVCYMSSIGKPICRCDRGFIGDRCQKNKCDGYCLNGGECSVHSSLDIPSCQCTKGFMGNRCEFNIEVCDIYCLEREKDEVITKTYDRLCSCHERMGTYSRRNHSAAALSSSANQNEISSVLSDPVIYLTAIVVICIMIIVVLSIFICTNNKKRPRIKKRIIVNKNVTPLTYRPQQPATEQCEITIENCCNMNVCETPCFEPREDKKKLLKNMEGDDLY